MKDKIEIDTILTGTLTGLKHYFFQVIEVKGKFCIVREINKEVTKEILQGWQQYVRPIKDSFKNDKTYRRKIRVGVSGEWTKLERTHYYLYPWNGKDKYDDHLD